MKTKNIFKALAVAMLLPAMLLTTACSNDDDAVNNVETTAKKGYELPATINVTRQSDAPTNRASYNESTHKLSFTAGDQLFVQGRIGTQPPFERFCGTLTWQSGGTFSGIIYTQEKFEGSVEELFTGANTVVTAYLLPNDYESNGYLSIEYIDENKYTGYLNFGGVPFATSKATAVEQFSFESANSYSPGTGFTLTPQNAILNFTITGLTGNTSVNVSLTEQYSFDINGSVTTNASGAAIFSMAKNTDDLSKCTLTVDGNVIALPQIVTQAGHIYNITRNKVPGNTIDLSTVTVATTAQDGDVLTGALANNVKISIADGATVILNNVNINGSGTWTSGNYAGITCEGDATIILKDGTTNTVRGFSGYYPGLQPGPTGTTLTIQGSTGSLTALCANVTYPGGTGIGAARNEGCGNIVIEGGNITATGGYAGIGGAYGSAVMGSGTCGDITILGGTVTATALSYGAGIGAGRGEYGSCGNITISGGTVTAIATAKNSLAAAIGAGSLSSTCTSVTIGTGITSLTMTNGHSSATGIVSDFINATAVNANTTPITTMLSTSVTDPTITVGMTSAGFATLYNEGTKTWTITK